MSLHAQDDSDDDQKLIKNPKFLTGFYVGAYFPNKYTASAYNGYGYGLDGVQNNFYNSLMYQKIMNQYGYGLGLHDRVADAIGVDQGQWDFSPSDMPINMHYTPAILLGLNFKLPVTKKSAFTFNLNGSKLNIEGNFTITLRKPQNPNPAQTSNVMIFPIRGSEQRLLFQLGFQQIFGKNDVINFFGEVGLNGTLAKYNSNTVYINSLQIELTSYWNTALYPTAGPAKKPVGFGLGAYGSLGVNMELNPKFGLQFLYTLSQEKVKIGNNPTLKFQNAVGMRVYYKLRSK